MGRVKLSHLDLIKQKVFFYVVSTDAVLLETLTVADNTETLFYFSCLKPFKKSSTRLMSPHLKLVFFVFCFNFNGASYITEDYQKCFKKDQCVTTKPKLYQDAKSINCIHKALFM